MRLVVIAALLLMPLPSQAESFRDCATCPEMTNIPAGTYSMGAPDSDPDHSDAERPRHSVSIATPFALGTTEVTVADYAAFFAETGYSGGDSCWTDNGMSWDRRPGQGWQSPGFPQAPDHPVTCVNTADADAYIRWLSRKTGHAYRLPTEAEWEYAARAGTTTRFPYGDRPDANLRLWQWRGG
ncbi:MAG: SUMF1/EgtB/PvdO family nonheme iron enzyme [Alphaproteobacteria bacterium]|nr:SUMF1/EgtB/PvdO family nonheme iron enzyme [Alphaproteobacteria bacterium]